MSTNKDRSVSVVPDDEDEVVDAAVVPEVQDINPADWLATDDTIREDYVAVNGGRLKIVAVGEAEIIKIQKSANKLDPTRPGAKRFEPMLFRQLMVCTSLSKAYPGTVFVPELLAKKLPGEVTRIFQAIAKLSGFEEPKQDQIESFFD